MVALSPHTYQLGPDHLGSRPARGWAYHARRRAEGLPQAKRGRVGRDPVRCAARAHNLEPSTVLTEYDNQKNCVCDGLKPECSARHVCLVGFVARIHAETQTYREIFGYGEITGGKPVEYSVQAGPNINILRPRPGFRPYVQKAMCANRLSHNPSALDLSTENCSPLTPYPQPV